MIVIWSFVKYGDVKAENSSIADVITYPWWIMISHVS